MPPAASCTCEVCPKCRNRQYKRSARANARRLRELRKARQAAPPERRGPTPEEIAHERELRLLAPFMQRGSAF